ncbi:MAG: 50S ribosomal protein L29 [Chloroflexi bacterium]|nr:MAG: 50S ribosomal protein L29 [Chloroflexota bacterium]RLC92387.1 MAG: 50S ribosomal protein L29 [Chloroflexota bacterium]HEY66945.1 50S ribosomal protein L29 [Thermoflexia bacterium]
MQAREIRTWTTEEIQRRLEEAYREFFVLRGEEASGRLEDYNRIRAVKRDIARMKTILRERELSAELIEGEGDGEGTA